MDPQSDFQFPLLQIKEIKPLLQKEDIVFAYEVKAVTENGFLVTFYENKGLDLRAYEGQKMKCLLEITRGRIAYVKNRFQEGSIAFQYLWEKRLFEYFPELMKIRNRLFDAKGNEGDSLGTLFESTATKTYHEWGLNGINLDIYQTKPLLSSSIGHFLLNEYEFEEEIDTLKLNDTIYIDIEEMFLRGICPLGSSKERITRPDAVQSEIPKQQELKEQPDLPPKPPKKKFNFFVD